ncbi:ead/Ea22-like family protein [Leclercia adecarboxylata]|uniref:ead/Ea22-like family protein n=1 Tax=Leclercia adecarboxylata TaxID=83655 RepID=UPI0004E2CF4A|nr:ead/Ea22-like family protein [Leclercia adecarboxylata]KFC98079.1 hypothetical protein GLAD_00733 [Leclercia adecarboxylata ATCC 23216 = NBRC 102595]UBH68424.1 ead/Ea22-like family protein [Leclercia adecarboxylata]SPX64196.1 Uncharacterised protein [Leclercia adecarboxylata]STX23192.1 Uncharacterised protein [Leclercia adecarboxylata]
MSNINKQALREAAGKAISEEGETWWNEEQLASDYGLALHRTDANFIAAANPATVLALLDELEEKDKRLNEILTPNMLLPVIDDMDEDNLRHVIKTVCENYSLLHAKWEAAEKRIAELEAREVVLPDYTEIYQNEFAKEVEYQVRAALKSAGIITKVGE